MSTSSVSLSNSNREMEISEEARELREWEHAKNTMKNRIESLSQTTFEIYGLHYRMWEFPEKYSHYLKLSMSKPGLDLERVRRQFYGPFKKLKQVAKDIQTNLRSFVFLQKKLNELAKRDDADPLVPEMNVLISSALESVKLFNLRRCPLRGTTVGIKRRSPTLLDEESRIVRRKTDHDKNNCALVSRDGKTKTG